MLASYIKLTIKTVYTRGAGTNTCQLILTKKIKFRMIKSTLVSLAQIPRSAMAFSDTQEQNVD